MPRKHKDCDCIENQVDRLKLQQDRLWGDHFWKTRIVVQSAVSESACLVYDIEALYENQDQIGANFGRLTANPKAGRKLAKELREHIRIAIEIVVAAIAGRSVDALYEQWQANGRAIAAVYHKYNHRIEFDRINELFQEHLATTLAEAVSIISGECEESITGGNVALEHIREMADYINSKF